MRRLLWKSPSQQSLFFTRHPAPAPVPTSSRPQLPTPCAEQPIARNRTAETVIRGFNNYGRASLAHWVRAHLVEARATVDLAAAVLADLGLAERTVIKDAICFIPTP